MANSQTEARVILVTGGSRGLGRSTALEAARKGYDIIFTYKDSQSASENVAAEIRALGRQATTLQLDTSDVGALEAFVSRLDEELRGLGVSKLYGLVNNAGIGLDAPIASTSEALFDQLFNIHFKSVFFLTQQLLPRIADGGRIINISSGLARVSLPGYAVYGSAKAAIETFTRFLAQEVGPRRITANVVAPGGLETDFGGGALRDIPQVNEFISAQTALGRAGRPDDVAPVIVSLLDDDHGWVTGQKIDVSGGWYL